MNQIAVLITCYNRKDITINCLRHLFCIRQDIDVFLVDDNSTDGTYAAIKDIFPNVKLFKGNGNLFWNRGMHLAWNKASSYKDYEYYLWLNDDVTLYDFLFDEMIKCINNKSNSIIVGIIENKDKSKVIYGGTDIKGNRINPLGKMKEVYLMNGNVVLIPRNVFKNVGNLDIKYHHDLGDIDYGLRAQKMGFKVYSTSIIIGNCISNNENRFKHIDSNIFKRLKKLYSTKGANPKLLFHFHKKHYGLIKAILYFIKLHLENILPISNSKK